jgi:hypothetical protein
VTDAQRSPNEHFQRHGSIQNNHDRLSRSSRMIWVGETER